MTAPVRIQLRRSKGWRLPAGAVLPRMARPRRAAVVAFVHDLPTLAQQIRDGEHRGKP